MEIVLYPDERLRAKNDSIRKREFTRRNMRTHGRKMLELMKSLDGVGLACPQVGINKRMFVSNKLPHEIICNPTWIVAKDAQRYQAIEGCLSFPGLEIERQRFDKIHVRYQCYSGKMWSMELSGFAAHVFQHETDHLNGKLMIDHFLKVLER